MRQGFTIPGGLADVRFRIFVDTNEQCCAPTAWSISDRRIINQSLKQPQDR
jgi:hypothetical protein